MLSVVNASLLRVWCLAFSRKVAILKPNTTSAFKRTYFSEDKLGVTEFKQLIERTTVPALQLQAKRKTLQECLSKPEAVPQESDILEFLYMAKKPKDVDLLIEAVNRYSLHNVFRHKDQFMNFLYAYKQTDRAFQLFMSREKTALNQSTRSVHALMNLLFVNRRHDDVITVYNKAMHMTDNSKKNRIFFPWLELYLDALVKKNTPESLTLAKAVLPLIMNANTTSDRYLQKIFLIAFNQNEYRFALELLSAFKLQTKPLLTLYKCMVLCRLKLADDVLSSLEQIRRIVVDREKYKKYVYSETIHELRALAASEAVSDYQKRKITEFTEIAGNHQFAVSFETFTLKFKDQPLPKATDDT